MADRGGERDLVSREAVLRDVRRVMRECVSGTDAVAALEEVQGKAQALPSAQPQPQGVPESVRDVLAALDRWLDRRGEKATGDLFRAGHRWRQVRRPGLTDPAPADEAGGGERVDASLLERIAAGDCVEKTDELGKPCPQVVIDPLFYCAPCLARRVLRGPTNDDATHPDEPSDGPVEPYGAKASARRVRELWERVEWLEAGWETLSERAEKLDDDVSVVEYENTNDTVDHEERIAALERAMDNLQEWR